MSNYDNWSLWLMDFLDEHDVWEVVEKCYNKPKNEVGLSQTQKDGLRYSRKRDKKALCVIYQGIYEDTFERISSVKSTKDVWEKIQTSFKGVDQGKKPSNIKRKIWGFEYETRLAYIRLFFESFNGY